MQHSAKKHDIGHFLLLPDYPAFLPLNTSCSSSFCLANFFAQVDTPNTFIAMSPHHFSCAPQSSGHFSFPPRARVLPEPWATFFSLQLPNHLIYASAFTNFLFLIFGVILRTATRYRNIFPWHHLRVSSHCQNVPSSVVHLCVLYMLHYVSHYCWDMCSPQPFLSFSQNPLLLLIFLLNTISIQHLIIISVTFTCT